RSGCAAGGPNAMVVRLGIERDIELVVKLEVERDVELVVARRNRPSSALNRQTSGREATGRLPAQRKLEFHLCASGPGRQLLRVLGVHRTSLDARTACCGFAR